VPGRRIRTQAPAWPTEASPVTADGPPAIWPQSQQAAELVALAYRL